MPTRATQDGVPGVRELPHTADAALAVEAPTLAALFERAALGMLELMVDLRTVEPRRDETFAVEADDLVGLLHDFLSAVLVRFLAGGFVACEVGVDTIDATSVRGRARGERFEPRRHPFHGEIKAVTYHALAVEPRYRGWWARVVFDV